MAPSPPAKNQAFSPALTIASLLSVASLLVLSRSGFPSSSPDPLYLGFALSPAAMSFLLMSTRDVKAAGVVHSCLASAFWVLVFASRYGWASFSDLSNAELIHAAPEEHPWMVFGRELPLWMVLSLPRFYVGATVSIFCSDASLHLLPFCPNSDLAHHVIAAGTTLVGLYMGPDAHGFLMLCHWFSLSAPSYTCLPKLLKMLGCPAPVVDVVWIAALAGWTFWRVPTLTTVYGVGFDGLRWRGFTPEYWEALSRVPPSPAYYGSVCVTLGMVLLYVINIYWCYTKINSIVKTVARLLGLDKGAAGEGGGRTAAPAFKKSAPCYHGGRSWDASGLDILGKRSEIVVADVLDAPFAPSPKCAKAVMDTLGADSRSACLRESPPTNCEPLIQAISDSQGIHPDHILVSSGSSSVIFSVFPQLLTRKSRILTIAPTYGEYAHAFGALCDVPDANVVQVKVDAKTFGDGSAVLEELTQLACEGERPFDFISLVNPNSPTGTLMDLRPFAEKLSEVCPNTVLWVDETYVDYAKASQKKGTVHSLEPLLPDCPNLLVCKSMSKSHSLSGVRAAYLAGQRCRELRRFIPPWSVSLPAQLCAIEALKDAAYYQKCYKKVAADRKAMVTALRKGGLDVVDGCANFFCLLLETESAADFVTHCQKEHGVFLRIINPTCVRIAVRSKDENARILAAIVDAAEVVAGAEGE
ncbi:hypothetical protein TeGR_g9989 [Tetraparma gracilis]|uniref:Aminotransferase class I/classII large domain-containing protein n=1 Tax=Tetraparma gracilis TaxID=2962635 RepID=A0ABQ6N7H0_9STRA|nr:hypothetical protein TeGR_g9989 [Tetraparma gracilis]